MLEWRTALLSYYLVVVISVVFGAIFVGFILLLLICRCNSIIDASVIYRGLVQVAALVELGACPRRILHRVVDATDLVEVLAVFVAGPRNRPSDLLQGVLPHAGLLGTAMASSLALAPRRLLQACTE